MQITSLRDMYLAELQELRSAQTQLIEGHQRTAGAVSSPVLADVFVRHRDETLLQKERLDDLLRQHGADPQAHADQAVEAMIHKAEKMLSIVQGSDLRDAALIASAVKVAYYEIAAYGTAAALAGQLRLREDQTVLDTCLDEAWRANALLTQLAKHDTNRRRHSRAPSSNPAVARLGQCRLIATTTPSRA